MALVLVLVGALAAGCAEGSTGMMRDSSRHASPGAMMGQRVGGVSGSTCSAPSSLPGTTVHVMLGDMGMTRGMGGVAPMGSRMMLRAVPARVPTGKVSLVVGNMGRRTHELVVLPLARGQGAGRRAAGGGRVDEAGSLGEASASCAAGAGDGIEAGTVGWVTLTLAAGRYELVCNLPDHYANGMHQLLVVS